MGTKISKIEAKSEANRAFLKSKGKCFKRRRVTREPREEKVQIKCVEKVLVWP